MLCFYLTQVGKGEGVLFNYESEKSFKVALELYESSYARGTGSSLGAASVRLFRLPLIAVKVRLGIDHDAGWKALRLKLKQHAKKLRVSRMKISSSADKEAYAAGERAIDDIGEISDEVTKNLLLKSMKQKIEAGQATDGIPKAGEKTQKQQKIY